MYVKLLVFWKVMLSFLISHFALHHWGTFARVISLASSSSSLTVIIALTSLDLFVKMRMTYPSIIAMYPEWHTGHLATYSWNIISWEEGRKVHIFSFFHAFSNAWLWRLFYFCTIYPTYSNFLYELIVKFP